MARNGRHGADPTLVVALAAGLTRQQAAKQAGVSLRTVARRLNDPKFRQQIAEARSATVEQASARLTAASLMAVQTLLQLLGAESESVRLGTARAILEMGVKFRETEALEAKIRAFQERLTALEERRGPRVIA